MPTPIQFGASAQALRPKNVSGQPPWSLQYAQLFAQADPGTLLKVERTGVTATSILGINLGAAPTPASIAALLKSHNQAQTVYYIEAWLQDGRILGTGWVTWWYIAVYS